MSVIDEGKFEAHITLSTAEREIGIKVAEKFFWKWSEIARDPVLGEGTYFYLTAYGVDFHKLTYGAGKMTFELASAGAHVLRVKIEQIVFDRRFNPPHANSSVNPFGERDAAPE